MTYEQCVKLVDWMNKKFPGWYMWATAEPFTWNKLLRIYLRFN